jgi:hypothetical protein
MSHLGRDYIDGGEVENIKWENMSIVYFASRSFLANKWTNACKARRKFVFQWNLCSMLAEQLKWMIYEMDVIRDLGWEWYMQPMIHFHIAQHGTTSLETHVPLRKNHKWYTCLMKQEWYISCVSFSLVKRIRVMILELFWNFEKIRATMCDP